MFFFVEFSLFLLIAEWVSIELFFFHNGRLETIFFRFASPSCNHILGLWIVLHSSFLSFFDVFLFGESLPFCHGFLFRKFEASWELDSRFGKRQIKFGFGKIMNLLFFRKGFNKWNLILFSFDGFEENKLDIINHGISDVADCFLIILTNLNSIGIIQSQSTKIYFSISFLHLDLCLNKFQNVDFYTRII